MQTQDSQSLSLSFASAATTVIQGVTEISLMVNGIRHKLKVEPRVTLLDALREVLKLTGTKKGCAHGQCGACTVLQYFGIFEIINSPTILLKFAGIIITSRCSIPLL